VAEPIRILLVEDNEVYREALKFSLELSSEVEVVASVGDGTQAAPAVREFEPEVVVMDYRLPGLDGVQATRAVREAAPGVAVVCLTGEASPREVEALFEAGATACLTKDQDREKMIDAIRRAAGRDA
jgi:two-component system, NarL family, response regulator DesR